jgi:hypothetical protein
MSVAASSWTDVQGMALLPIDCDTVIIYNNAAVNILLRTDPGNANSQITLLPGQQYEFGGNHSGVYRYPRGCPAICSLQSVSGTVNVIVESVQ